MIITQPVALGIQHAQLSSVTCPAPRAFSTSYHKRHHFRGEKILNTKYVSSFSTNSFWNIFHSKKKWARYDRKCILVFMWSTLYSCLILIKIESSRIIFKTYSNIKFSENPSSGSRIVQCRQTDRQTERHAEVNSRSSIFCETPYKYTKLNLWIFDKNMSISSRIKLNSESKLPSKTKKSADLIYTASEAWNHVKINALFHLRFVR